tara:strand:+ start:142821 stop:143453 length:633 start_codon:yes stop_codon:yes gene_type:complete
MGQKVNPKSFRLPVRRNWDSRWVAPKKEFPILVEEDYKIRKLIKERLRYAAVARIFIERSGNRVRVKVFTARPGIVIGRKGQELDKLKEDLQSLTGKDVLVDIQEIKKADIVAQLVAEGVAVQIERRISFKRAMKKAVQTAMSLGVLGIRIQCSGRLAGADIARTESQENGKVSLNTLRDNIDYGFAEAKTTYGITGIKCWIYKETEDQL